MATWRNVSASVESRFLSSVEINFLEVFVSVGAVRSAPLSDCGDKGSCKTFKRCSRVASWYSDVELVVV